MRNKLEKKSIRWAIAISLLLTGFSFKQSAYGQTPEKTYFQVKQIEGTIKWPNIYVTKKIGVFDAATGQFAFTSASLRTIDETIGGDPGEKPYQKPQHIHEEGQLLVQATDVGLIFEVKNRNGDFSATVNGKKFNAPPNANTVTVNAGDVTKVKWSVHSDNKGFANEFKIVRSNLYGGGAFIVPALPVAVLYEPPMDAQQKNYASYSTSKSVGTTIKSGWTSEQSTTTPANPSQFRNAMQFKADADKAGTALSKVPNPYAQAIGTILQILAAGMGSAGASTQSGTSVTSENALILNAGQEVSYGTAAKLGPGLGDRIIYLKNARLAWLGNGHMVNISVLGYDKISSPTAKTLKDDWTELTSGLQIKTASSNGVKSAPKLGSRTGLDSHTILSLLKLDPFYGHGSQVNLDESRFAYVDTYEPNGGADSYKFVYDAATSYLDAQTSFNVDTEEYSAGFLSFMGLGVTETKKLTAKFTAHSSKEFHSSQKAEVSVHFYTKPDEIYSMAVYYDRVFGTFAFKNVVPNQLEWVSGIAHASNGQPAAKQVVTLTIGGKKYSTRTDAEGRYSFRSSNITGGDAQIEIGNIRKPVRLQTGKPVRNLELR